MKKLLFLFILPTIMLFGQSIVPSSVLRDSSGKYVTVNFKKIATSSLEGGGGGVTIETVMDSIDNNTIPTSIDSGYALIMYSSGKDSIIQSGFRANATRDTIRAKDGTVVYPVAVGDGWTYAYTTVDTTHTVLSGATAIAYEIAFTLLGSSLYEFEYQMYMTTNDGANGTGTSALATVSSAPTTIGGIASSPLNAGAGASLLSHDVQTSNTDTVRSLSSFSNTVPMPFIYTGRVLTNGAGVLNLAFQAELSSAAATVTLKKGSYGRIRKIY